ncbi:ATP-dependent Clp protease proteolytic subunit [Roseobacter sp.]|uniref:ATP-dependent Clp protease proteolytic subunit n=1 Tax=Roseobacter sp. TaxID=1907202 RepID=UPI002965E22E|nr:ATP-dependent Clp protease proteolytic subunit [Roseobacter sp.]MDW3181496.1 ATP-dependent Clp protease proteolytic subunit [Roseobacter sp.]
MSDQMLDDTGKAPEKARDGRIEALFFRSRNVIITGEITDKLAHSTVTHLLALAEESDDPINVYISSPGGHVESGDMVHDVIKFIRPKVRAIGSGWVASAGALIFVGAAAENRYCLPNTRFLLHEPRGGIGGQATDMMIQAEQIRIMRARFHTLFADATGQTPEKIAEDTGRDFWLTTQEALDYGLVGRVISSVDQL